MAGELTYNKPIPASHRLPQARGRGEHTVWEIRRIGKQPTIRFDNNVWLIIHLVTAGYLRGRESGAKVGAKTGLAAFDFADRRLTQPKPGTKTGSAAIGI